ncbi:MAG: glutathione peroxidase [Myxococcota bacterium]|nr:glutathione peroxidase [Myxococcota bacterium]
MPKLHDFTLKNIDGADCSLSDYEGKAVLIVNVASKCGLTPQYDGLQRLYEEYNGRGLEILGVPCNQFAGQEPGTSEEIKDFCSTNFNVSFPLFSKLEVNGDGADPLYGWLTSLDVGPEEAGDVKWNFGKFLANKDGEIVGRFDPSTEPQAADLIAAIEGAL